MAVREESGMRSFCYGRDLTERLTLAAPSNPLNLTETFGLVVGHWSPHIVAEFNGLHVKLVRVQGEFVWHSHQDTDEVFLVHKGSVTIEMRNKPPAVLHSGDLFVVPAGVEHRPIADEECELVLIEPAETPNTGDAATAAREPWI